MSGETVDCDFWPQRAVASLIAPYMDPALRAWLHPGERAPGGGEVFDLSEGGINSLAGAAAARAVEDDPHGRATNFLDRLGITRAIINPGVAAGVSGLANGRLAAQFGRAINDWLAAEWLEADERYLGSIVVSARDPKLAAEEIRRLGGDRRFVQILVAYPPNVLGDQSLRPIHEAAEEYGLPIHLQAGGWFSGINRGVSAVGYPNSPLEDQLASVVAAQPHLISMILRGTFDRFPGLRLVLSGFGIAWLPGLLWRMDFEAQAGRLGSVVELSRRPSEYVRERVRFTTQPLEVPKSPGSLATLLELVGGEELLLYASGPPRWRDTADPDTLRAILPAGWIPRVLCENTAALYRL